MPADKSSLRAAARAKAADLDWASVGVAVRAHLARWLAERTPTTVMMFVAMADECPLEELSTQPALAQHRWVVPRIWPDGRMTAHPLDAERERHAFGLWQPVPDAEQVHEVEFGVVLIPGMLFDRQGGRLGRGKGFYDRFLPRLSPATALVGVTAEALICDDPLPLDPHDARVGWLATERGVTPSAAWSPQLRTL